MTLPEVVYRCTWDTGWSQYHDASDPMPTKWDDKPPDFVEAFVSKIDAESRLAAADALLRDCIAYIDMRVDGSDEMYEAVRIYLQGAGDE